MTPFPANATPCIPYFRTAAGQVIADHETPPVAGYVPITEIVAIALDKGAPAFLRCYLRSGQPYAWVLARKTAVEEFFRSVE